MTAHACAFIIHAGFAQIGRLAIPVLLSGPKPVHARALRLAPFAVLVLRHVRCLPQRQDSYMFTGTYMAEPFIQQGRSGFA